MSNKIILALLLASSIYANSILTEYRQTGVIALEKKMDFELTKVDYWDEHLKNIDTSFGYVESYSSVLTCNKEESTLSLYQYNKDKEFSLKKKYNAFTGKIKGDKLKEGDLKTPIGLYEITKRISKLDSFYGPLAFVSSYPNIYDKFQGKNGSGIWIHGLPTEQERDEYTKGCIAINNPDIECLNKNIDINNTLLIISSSKNQEEIPKEKLSKILASLYEWRYSWIYSETEKYLNFYAQNFVRADGMKYKYFKKYKTRIFKKKETKKIIFNDINVVAYPNHKNIFRITFKEFYNSSSFKFEGNKVLMIKLENNNFKIFTEK